MDARAASFVQDKSDKGRQPYQWSPSSSSSSDAPPTDLQETRDDRALPQSSLDERITAIITPVMYITLGSAAVLLVGLFVSNAAARQVADTRGFFDVLEVNSILERIRL
ncbi:uncharacterized protein [Palaemon carinicauda]|uniref:uncharacterized protein n=1 Tax=Palaemon carinicauda TaxID=392227 RepID=UPI0035B69BAB